ncbi:hypothetical protein CCACVL1_01731 [Corchorus capsularis]|uniref:Uncharacterized protein n=1 Tax=Corchorus capsularis TaxID=210143 RepID=A0A1R3KG31_COCAP|nr:hypothetical protein CCACVL1_01731 [Corchorus capsularis]
MAAGGEGLSLGNDKPPSWKSMAGERPWKNFKPPISELEVESFESPDSLEEAFIFLFFRQPPPIGTFRNAPPLVQYLRQVLQKCLG